MFSNQRKQDIAIVVEATIDAFSACSGDEWNDGEEWLTHNGDECAGMMAFCRLLNDEETTHAWECYHWQVACRKWQSDGYVGSGNFGPDYDYRASRVNDHATDLHFVYNSDIRHPCYSL